MPQLQRGGKERDQEFAEGGGLGGGGGQEEDFGIEEAKRMDMKHVARSLSAA